MICVCDRVSVCVRYGMIAPGIVLVLYHDIPAAVKQGKKIARVLAFERCCGAEGGDRCREGRRAGVGRIILSLRVRARLFVAKK